MLSERARAWAAENELVALAETTMDTQWTVVVSLGLRKPIERHLLMIVLSFMPNSHFSSFKMSQSICVW